MKHKMRIPKPNTPLTARDWVIHPETTLASLVMRLAYTPLTTFVPAPGHEDWPHWSRFFRVEDQRDG